jgi:DNA-binding transcriptional MerR regulator
MANPALQVLTTGALARATGLGRETLRFYEEQGLIAPVARTAAGYRQFTMKTIEEIAFIKQTQRAGFSIREISHLLQLRLTNQDTCGALKQILSTKLQGVDAALVALQARRAALGELVLTCSQQDATRICDFVRTGPGCC